MSMGRYSGWNSSGSGGSGPYFAVSLSRVWRIVLASGPAIRARWGITAEEIATDHEAWPLEAHYLALACTNLILTYSPQRIILGGGVMQQVKLLPMIRQETLLLLNGYLQSPVILDHIERYIVAPGLGNQSGALGALALAGAGRRPG